MYIILIITFFKKTNIHISNTSSKHLMYTVTLNKLILLKIPAYIMGWGLQSSTFYSTVTVQVGAALGSVVSC